MGRDRTARHLSYGATGVLCYGTRLWWILWPSHNYVHETAIEAGCAAEKAATRKHTKYLELERRDSLVPVAVEILGLINKEGLDFISEIGRQLSKACGDNRKTKFLFQSISVTIQRNNTGSTRWCFSIILSINCLSPLNKVSSFSRSNS